MKFFVVVMSLIAVATAASLTPAEEARRREPAVDHREIHDELGQFALRYETAEGTIVSERGRLVPSPDGTGNVMILEGEVSYISDDGQRYDTKYTAGLDGNHVEGNHLPTQEPAVVSEPVEVVPAPVEVDVKNGGFKMISKRLH